MKKLARRTVMGRPGVPDRQRPLPQGLLLLRLQGGHREAQGRRREGWGYAGQVAENLGCLPHQPHGA